MITIKGNHCAPFSSIYNERKERLMNAKVKRAVTTLLLACVTALPCALSFQHEALASNTTPIESADPSAPPALVSDHIAYIAGYPDGTMGPSRSVTRAEAVTFLYRLLADPDSGTGTCSYTDVTDSDWFAEPVRAVCRLELTTDGTSFRPNDAITRAEFVSILVNLTDDVAANESFSDVPSDYWAADAISKAAALGWVGGYEDGTFRPENTLTRAEACAVFNRITARTGDSDQAKALLSLGLYDDVSASHWAGTDIVEASVAHVPGIALFGEN
ncbi:MAG: S-layer homology domain-containing protein, partial [Peptococcaceae bacterium]|nr:S-layer homology domain-containing protein [Peptococcaceae bacterium]